MRGEETQVFGVLAAMGGSGLACLPGSHSKWARVEDGRIVGFTTHMTGEAFAALRGHTILGRMMRDGPSDGAPFDAGRRAVRRCGRPAAPHLRRAGAWCWPGGWPRPMRRPTCPAS